MQPPTEGAGFVLFQFVDEMDPGSGAVIVNANSNRFKESQLNFSPIEAEGMALDFAISCCHYWISYYPQVELYLDCSGLLDLLGKPLCDIENRRLERILTRAQSFNFFHTMFQGVSNQIVHDLFMTCS